MTGAVVEVRGLRKEYGPVVAVDRLDLDVPRGALFGLLGPNGARKSTTFGVMCGFLRPTAGSTTVLGVSSRELFRLRGRVTALPQDAAFPRNVSVLSQLVHFGRLAGLPTPAAHSEAQRVLELVGMSEAQNRRGGELSHGMAKRVGLAQTLLASPEVIFLDEPTAGLDPASSRQLKDLIGKLVPTVTVVLSSHNLAEVQEICTHGAILDRGKLVAHGTIDDLTRRGAEVAIEVGASAQVPREKLAQLFGNEAVAVDGTRVRITFSSQSDPAEVISRALRVLLDHQVPILGVHRGTSLEHTFLEVTRLPAA
ncbi:MAG: ABC transporter ATP-binding protein [Deltaproteobacteria bacterium]|nr:ABC transporter ATP-binding protein [Deltaproteobacteria bacterium]